MTEQKYIRVEDINNPVNPKTYTPADILAGMWVPVSERLPEPRKKVLARHADGRIRVGWRSILGNFMDEPLYGIVTHWMPLPQPPKENKP